MVRRAYVVSASQRGRRAERATAVRISRSRHSQQQQQQQARIHGCSLRSGPWPQRRTGLQHETSHPPQPPRLSTCSTFSGASAAVDKQAKAVGGMDPSSSTSDTPPTYWLSQLKRQGSSPYHPDKSRYQVFRSVKDFGAVGDGIHDDTDSINRAISQGGRCGEGLPDSDSSTISPAVVYFPRGKYLVTRPIVSYYYTSLIGDALAPSTIIADASFQGLAVIDENPYLPDGHGRTWYCNTNNFFRSVAFLTLDLTRIPDQQECAGIHHQVAQATGLRHVAINMPVWSPSTPTRCKGLFMENGSGGHMTSLTFVGGAIGIWAGNQQFTVSNVGFRQCQRAISQHWSWTWVYHQIRVQDCQIAFEMRVALVDHQGEKEQATASVTCLDWEISSTDTAFDIVSERDEPARGSLVLSNVQLEGVRHGVVRSYRPWSDAPGSGSRSHLVSYRREGCSSTRLDWAWHGDGPPGTSRGGPLASKTLLPRPQSMLDERGRWLVKLRPEYRDRTAADFVSVKDWGARGDGEADDTLALQQVLDAHGHHPRTVVWIPHGHYRLTKTLVIPPNARICGELWPVLYGHGPFFQNATRPRPVIKVGEFSGQRGTAEISECIFSTKGPCPGAIVLQWNVRAEEQGGSHSVSTPGLFDTHIRLGGFMGSDLDDARFDKDQPLDAQDAWACSLAWHITPGASGCFVNIWVWLADHILDSQPTDARHAPTSQAADAARVAGQQISLLGSRGILIESDPGPVWLWGGASEHFLLYQYQLLKARNVFIGHAQTESPYFLGEGVALPTALVPAGSGRAWDDPSWTRAKEGDTYDVRSWGIRIVDSASVHLYGPGLYSFFDAYRLDRHSERRCQRALLSVEACEQEDVSEGVTVVNLNTVGVQSMVDWDGRTIVEEADYRNGVTNTLGRLCLN
ncbi:unnamed protein product [Parajaminaea phylloscopi]